jgi:hypothetical protein
MFNMGNMGLNSFDNTHGILTVILEMEDDIVPSHRHVPLNKGKSYVPA